MAQVFGGKKTPTDGSSLQVSFLELAEIVVVSRFRKDSRIQLERIRRAHAYAKKVLKEPFPFATTQFKEFGGHIIHEFEESEPGRGQMAFDTGGQWVLPGFVQEGISSFDFEPEDRWVKRWFPFGRLAHVVVDPHYAAGRPIVEGTRVPVRMISERFKAGDTIQFLARDYGLKASVVEEVLRLAA